MKNVIEILERFYSSFMGLENPKDFFEGLKDYFDFTDSTPELDKITDGLLAQRKPFEEKMERLKPIAIKKVSKVQSELSAYILKNKIGDERINNLLRDYNGWVSGKIVGSPGLPLSAHRELCDIVGLLYQMPEHKNFASRYLEFWQENKELIKRHIPLKELDDYLNAESEFKRKYENELWGQIIDVNHLYQMMKCGEEKRKKLIALLKKNHSTTISYELLNFDVLFGEWKAIEGNRITDLFFFDVKKVRRTIVRFHNYLLKELNKAEVKKESEAIKPYFDLEKSVLLIKDKIMKIQKFSDQYHTLRIINENNLDITNECFFSEIAENYLDDRGKISPDKKFYNAIYQINQKIAKKTGIEDYFLTTKQSFRINPEYVKPTLRQS